jgi:two-component system sensor histidine kinase TctE
MSAATHSLRLRLFAALLLVWALGAGAMTVFLQSQAASPDEQLEENSLSTQARDLVGGLRFDAAGRLTRVTIPQRWRQAYDQPGAAYFTLFDPAGRMVAKSANLAQPMAPTPLADGVDLTPLRLVGPDQDLAVTAKAPNGYRLVAARSNPGRVDETPMERMEDFAPILVFILAAAVGLAIAAFVVAWSLRRLSSVAREAAAIGPDSLDARLSLQDLPSEIRPLAVAVNRALDRVSKAYDNEKRFTAEAAHALRTPLAVLDLRLQRAEQGGAPDWPAVRADIAELTRVVSGLLALSRADRARTFRASSPVNLTRVVREAAAALAPSLERDRRAIAVEAPEEALSLGGDAGELREMVFALIENALTHGRGDVVASLRREADETVLTVLDEGDGVAAEARETVFERFHKLEATSPGAGLGLAIVRQTARNHGGEARFVDGAAVEVRLRG